MERLVNNPIESRRRFLASPLKHLGFWSGKHGLNPMDIVPSDSVVKRIRINHVDAFSIISEWPHPGGWENAQRFSVPEVEIGLGTDGIPNMGCIIEGLNQVLQMFDVGILEISILCPNGRTPSLDGMEFLNRVGTLRLVFQGNYEFRRLSVYLEYLTFLKKLEIHYNINKYVPVDDCDSIIIQDYPRLSSFDFVGMLWEDAGPEVFDPSTQKNPTLIIRNCPALQRIEATNCNIDMDSSSPSVIFSCDKYPVGRDLEGYLTRDYSISFPKFVGVKPEKFFCSWARLTLQHMLQHLNTYQPRILTVKIIEMFLGVLNVIDTLKELDVSHLSVLTIDGVLVADFEFLSKATQLTSVTIEPRNIEQFDLWNNSLEPDQRFRSEPLGRWIVCRR